MPSPERLVAWLEQRLAGEAEAQLNAMATMAGAAKVMTVRNPRVGPATTWFYEGTIQAVVHGCVERWLRTQGNREWLLLSEQPYPIPVRDRADLALLNEAGEWVFVEIKSDFDLDTAYEDVTQLLVVAQQLRRPRYVFGLVLYAIWNDASAIAQWARHLDGPMQRSGIGRARPLIRR